MDRPIINRRTFVSGAAGAAGLAAFGRSAQAQLPTSPVALNFVDVAGNLALTQKAIEAYRDKNPKLVSRITFTKAPAPELPARSRRSRTPSASTSTPSSPHRCALGRRRSEAVDPDRV